MYTHRLEICSNPLVVANQIDQARVRPACDNLPRKPKKRRVIDHRLLRCGKCLHIGLPEIQPSEDSVPKASRKCKQILRSHRDHAILSKQQMETRARHVAVGESIFWNQPCGFEPKDTEV